MFLSKKAEAAYNLFSDEVFADGVLDARTKQLIALAASFMVDCVPCIQHHYRDAAAAGATPGEFAEVSAIVMAISAGSKRAKYKGVIADLNNAEKK